MNTLKSKKGCLAQHLRDSAVCATLALSVALAAGCSSGTTPVSQATEQGVDARPDTVTDAMPETEQPAPAFGPDSGAVKTNVVCDATGADIQSAMMQLINEFRESPQSCGDKTFPAAAPLEWNTTLEQASSAHSLDMVTHNFFSHTGSDGSSASARVTAAGYNWSTVGENIAGGQPDADAAVLAWKNSSGHCANMMKSSFTELAVSCRKQSGTDLTNYWTLVFGSPL